MPWEHNDAWDDAIEASPDVIAVAGTRSANRRSTVFLRRPGQMICDSGVWNDPSDTGEEQLRGLLGGAGAEETRGAPRLDRDGERADVADRLGLTLLNVPDDEQLTLFREGRRLVPDALAFNHVLVAGPQRFGGDGVPKSIPEAEAQVEIPSAEAGGAKKVAVLDTGFIDGAPFSVLSESDIEPPVAGPANPAMGHGTMVAGVLRRFAPNASILVKRVLNMPLGEADELEVAAALGALPPGIDVVNASFGGPAADATRMLGLQRALDALPQETLVVAAAGNEGMARRHFMAAFKGVVAVGSAARPERPARRLLLQQPRALGRRLDAGQRRRDDARPRRPGGGQRHVVRGAEDRRADPPDRGRAEHRRAPCRQLADAPVRRAGGRGRRHVREHADAVRRRRSPPPPHRRERGGGADQQQQRPYQLGGDDHRTH